MENMITFGTPGPALLDLGADYWMSSALSSSGILTPSSHGSDTYSDILGVQLPALDTSVGYHSSAAVQPTRNRAGNLSCPLCPQGTKIFRTLQAFHNHLASPAHAPKIYHCPVDLMPSKRKGKKAQAAIKEFSTLSGMAQHIESGACEGGRNMLEGAIEFVQDKLKELGFEEIRLLK
ncbi:MAG: hypothetical protein Q9181_007958 [Wetmoreana brouardii]